MTSEYLLVACVNSDDLLKQNLRASPDVDSGALPTRFVYGASSAASAYAAVVAERPAKFIVCAHQDVYLPTGFRDGLDAVVRRLSEAEEDWAVIGVYGARDSGEHAGRIYDGSNGRLLGDRVADPVPVAVVDEALIVVRVDSGVTFDPQLPGFHLYGTQIAVDARASNKGVFVADLPIIHNSRSIMRLGEDYEAAWRYLSETRSRHLPVPNLCCGTTSRSRWPLWKWRFKNDVRIRLGRRQTFERVQDVRLVARQMGLE